MVNFGYAESSRTAWAAQDPVSKMKKKNNPQRSTKKECAYFSVFAFSLLLSFIQ